MTTIKHIFVMSRAWILVCVFISIAIIPLTNVWSMAGFTSVWRGQFPFYTADQHVYLPIVSHNPSTWSVASPDGSVVLTIRHASMPAPYPTEQRLYYTVERDGATMIDYSPLGISMEGDNGDFVDNLRFIGAQRNLIDETYPVKTGKRSEVVNRANELILHFRNRADHDMELVVRAYDDGAAYRYHFPGSDSYAVTAEHSGFRLPVGTVAWAQQWQNNYEQEYYRRSLDELDTDHEETGWGHPLLLALPDDNWALLAEAAVDGSYAPLHFRGSNGDRILRLGFPPDQTTPLVGSSPLATPWRVVIVGPDLGGVVESDLVTNLSPPAQLGDTDWIEPGRVAWSWWSNTRSPESLEIQKEYVDFAQEMGWEYVLVDEGWNADWVPELVAYANQRNVGIILWSYARLFDEETAQQWAEWGVKGAKLDFIDSDRQEAFQTLYDPMYEITARHKLMLNFHGSSKPAGEQRQWPHHLTRESVRGAEYRDLNSRENINLVFTRNVIGSMDYTPVVLSRPKGEWPMTFANQLALAILFESGWQHFPDTPDHYRASPGKALLQAVPTTWDDTKFIAGHPDQFIVLARRKGADWYVGVNGTDAGARQVPLTFLTEGQTYQATIYKDGASDTEIVVETRTVTAQDTLTMDLRENGGSAIQLVPVGE